MSDKDTVEVGRFEVNPAHKTRENCPDCGEESDLFHLGSVDGVVGWVCGTCRGEIHENPETGEFWEAN